MKIKYLEQTCKYCPAQWEARTDCDHPVYIRYRWGELRIEIGPKGATLDDAVFGYELYCEQRGEGMDGTLAWDDISELVESLEVPSEEEILEGMK